MFADDFDDAFKNVNLGLLLSIHLNLKLCPANGNHSAGSAKLERRSTAGAFRDDRAYASQ